MLIRIRKSSDPSAAEIAQIASKEMILGRRAFMGAAAAAAGVAMLPTFVRGADAAVMIDNVKKTKWGAEEKPTSLKGISSYNNFYEFGTGKEDPAENAHSLKTDPWTIEVAGHAAKTGKFSVEDLIKGTQLEERIYRMRCVEAWSMVIPWVGVTLASVLQRFEPTSQAKFVAFETLVDAKQMPGQRAPILDWPYVEGLRIDEAMHPLTILAVGIHGEVLPNQNGAPVRLVVPWKYGFKSIKSIVKINFVEKQPPATWNMQAAHEYGFYSNVNPRRDHPRWSQKRERRLSGEGGLSALFAPTIETKMFNGYAEEVASLYAGMDLLKSF